MFALLVVQLSVFTIVYRSYLRHFIKMVKDVFLVKERHSLFTQTVSNDGFFRNFMLAQSLLLCTLAIYSIARAYGYISHLSEIQLLLTIGAIFSIAFLFFSSNNYYIYYWE